MLLTAGQGRDHSALVTPPFQSPVRGERTVVVSPHLDDGVLSLGAAMSSWTRHGVRVELLTVLAGDPDSDAPAGGWDGRGGFVSEGDAARRRREEDAQACAIIGVTPSWLPFGDGDYDRHGDETSVARAVAGAVEAADAVLVPGFPLSHPDHEWLVRVIVERGVVRGRVGFYAEQPYASRTTATAAVPTWLSEAVGLAPDFAVATRGPRDLVAKWRAIRSYRSQLPLLAMRGVRRGAHVAAWRRELIAQGTA
jgi:LmbE family N-acetylglucosaminyl deacetylase